MQHGDNKSIFAIKTLVRVIQRLAERHIVVLFHSNPKNVSLPYTYNIHECITNLFITSFDELRKESPIDF